jgi:hypothetical protein
MRTKATVELLRRLFPFSLLLLATCAVGGSGLVLREIERYSSLSWGALEMLHVGGGLILTALLLGYLGHHLHKHWGSLSDRRRLLGLAITLDLTVALATGLAFEFPASGPPPEWVAEVHYFSTFPILPLILWHSAAALKRWLSGNSDR